MSRALSVKSNQDLACKNSSEILDLKQMPQNKSLYEVTKNDLLFRTPHLSVNSATEPSPVIATYKDLNQVSYDQLLKQRKQFMFAIAFILLTSTMLIGYQQVIKNNVSTHLASKQIANLKE